MVLSHIFSLQIRRASSQDESLITMRVANVDFWHWDVIVTNNLIGDFGYDFIPEIPFSLNLQLKTGFREQKNPEILF